MKNFSLTAIQKSLTEMRIDGWLLTDLSGRNPTACSILKISSITENTRRWVYFIPASGAPKKIVHGIERDVLDHLPGKKEVYIGWREMAAKLQTLFKQGDNVALDYSPDNAIPSVSRIEAGLFEILIKFKIKPVSAANLIQQFEALLSKAQMNTHINVAGNLNEIRNKTLQYIKRKLKNHEEITELSIQNFVRKQIKSLGLISDRLPGVAAGENTGNPGYIPANEINKPVYPGDLVQVTYRAKEKDEDAVYASTAWVVYIGKEIPDDMKAKFEVINKVHSDVAAYIDRSIKNKKIITGWEVDRYARHIVAAEGLEAHYLQRTGQSLGTKIHSDGVNLDDLESHDTRTVSPGLCFSLAPALYFTDYGICTDTNIYLTSKGAHYSSKSIQESIFHI